MSRRATAAVVLAGGKSRRMGMAKHAIRLADGRTMLQHVLSALDPWGPVIIAGGSIGDLAFPPEAQVVPDLRPDAGPLAGVEAVLRSGFADRYLVAACDQPLLTADLPAALGAASADGGWPLCLRTADGLELDPFPALIPAGLAGESSRALDEGMRSVRQFLRRCGVQWVEVPAGWEQFTESMNTPGDLHRAGVL